MQKEVILFHKRHLQITNCIGCSQEPWQQKDFVIYSIVPCLFGCQRKKKWKKWWEESFSVLLKLITAIVWYFVDCYITFSIVDGSLFSITITEYQMEKEMETNGEIEKKRKRESKRERERRAISTYLWTSFEKWKMNSKNMRKKCPIV